MVLVLVLLIGGGEDEQPAPEALAETSLDDAGLAGQRLIAGWDGAQPPRGLRRLIAKGGVAGVILFADNLESPAKARRTLRSLQRIERPEGLGDPLLVMVDQEGGQVKRLAGPPTASADQLGAGGQQAAFDQGRETAGGLLDVGINVNLAPVLDVARPGSAIDREQRSYGGDPETVIEIGVDGFAAGLAEGGVIATAKHFPGLGAAQTNTDLAAQSIDLGASTLEGTDEAPFAAFAEAGGGMVMLSLATYPALANRPAAFSPKIVQGQLRERIGFGGVTITDGLGAAAAAAFGDRRKVALAAERAGNDLLLYSDWRAARDVQGLFESELGSGDLDRARFEAAADRVLDLRAVVPDGGSDAG